MCIDQYAADTKLTGCSSLSVIVKCPLWLRHPFAAQAMTCGKQPFCICNRFNFGQTACRLVLADPDPWHVVKEPVQKVDVGLPVSSGLCSSLAKMTCSDKIHGRLCHQ